MGKLRTSIFFRGTEDSTRGGTTCRGREGGTRCKRELHQVVLQVFFLDNNPAITSPAQLPLGTIAKPGPEINYHRCVD
jgi:hypothetical protein